MKVTSIVKFTIEFESRDVPHDERISHLIRWCTRFNEVGLTPSSREGDRSLGNLSFRLHDDSPEFIITASMLTSKENLTPNDFVKVHHSDPRRKVVVVSGAKDPSSESMMHYQIYARRNDIGAVFHGHDMAIIENAAALGLPETAREERSGTPELLNEVMKILRNENFIVMKNHGFLSLGRTMEDAGLQALQIKYRIINGRRK